MVLNDVIEVRVEYEIPDLTAWDATPSVQREEFRDEIRQQFAEAAGVQVDNVFVRLIITRDEGRRRLQTTAVNTGTCIVVVEVRVPPALQAAAVRDRLVTGMLATNENSEPAFAKTLTDQTELLGLAAPTVTQTVINQVPLIASPPPPSPDNVTPYTDVSLIAIVAGSCVGVVLLIVLARECDVERLRIVRQAITRRVVDSPTVPVTPSDAPASRATPKKTPGRSTPGKTVV